MNIPVKKRDMMRLAEYQQYLYKDPQLRFLFFELTDKCNLNCLHCGSSCTGNNSHFLSAELVQKTLQSVATRYDPHKIMICITGGEPFLHPDLFRIISMAHQSGFAVGITSNGTLINEEKAHQLKEAGLDTMAISVDGLNDVHDTFRRSKGCFDKAISGIRALKSVGIEPQVISVIHKESFFQLNDMYDFFQKEGIYSWRISNIEPIGRGIENDNLLLSGEQLKRLYMFIREKRFDRNNDMEVTYGCSHFVSLDFEREIRDFYFECSAGTLVASVMANGDIGGCLDIERRPELIQGNVYKDDFVNIWENKFKSFRTDKTRQSSRCSVCEHRKICMGDSLHTWDFDKNEPRYCVSKIIKETSQ